MIKTYIPRVQRIYPPRSYHQDLFQCLQIVSDIPKKLFKKFSSTVISLTKSPFPKKTITEQTPYYFNVDLHSLLR